MTVYLVLSAFTSSLISLVATTKASVFFFFYSHFLYECENWLLTLREEHRLRVFENRV